MANGKQVLHFSEHEDNRERQFKRIWVNELDDVFADVAKYYDQANHIASLGLRNWLHESFLSTIQLHSGQKVLDVCAGTNAIGIATLHKQSDLDVHALDRSKAMQEVGQYRARQQGMKIKSFIGDAHSLPFADNYFDVVTLQYASRHLRILDVCQEVHRVLKPDGHFYHSDMLRPANKVVEMAYYLYLRASLTFTALLFRSGPAALNCREYFISALKMFYSADEFSQMLYHVGFVAVSSKTVLGGTVGFHRAAKAKPTGISRSQSECE
jgi:demethylmenaquinone methyltransferase/2-methoxy-6-polyprenyl-1,4-benzoquinol methylase